MGKRYKPLCTTDEGIRIYAVHPVTGEVLSVGFSYERGSSDLIEKADASGIIESLLVAPRTPPPEEALERYRHVEGMERFTEREKDAVILCVCVRMSDKDAAAYLGISPEALRKAKSRAREKCEGTFQPNVTTR
jgi:hypothetical protein